MDFNHVHQTDLVGFPTSHSSVHVQMPTGSRANTNNPDTAEFPPLPAAEDSQGAALAAIKFGRGQRWQEQNHTVALFCCGNTSSKETGRMLNSSPYTYMPIQHVSWQDFPVIFHRHCHDLTPTSKKAPHIHWDGRDNQQSKSEKTGGLR